MTRWLAGIGLTLDMSAFFEQLSEAFGDDLEGSGQDLEEIEDFLVMKMRMYMIGSGDKVGMLMQIGFGGADTIDDEGLAETLYGNLR